MKRTAVYRVDSLLTAAGVAGDVDTWLVDLENCIVGYNPTADEVAAALERARETLPGRVIFISNGRSSAPGGPSGGFISRAHKPFTRRSRLGLRVGERAAVVGDLAITDGLLAWRLHVPFIHLVMSTQEPLWPRLLRLLSAPLRRALFSSSNN